MLGIPVIYDGSQQRRLGLGDLVSEAETIRATDATVNLTITGAILAKGIILRSPAGASADPLDTAANIVAALSTYINGPLTPGQTFRFITITTTAQTVTYSATANTGVTVNRGAIAASSGKEFLITIVTGTPAQTYTAMTTNASAVITGMTAAQTATLSPGMIVTNAVNGLQGTTILSVQPGVGVTMSGNANATSVAPGVAINFSPQIQMDGLFQGGI